MIHESNYDFHNWNIRKFEQITNSNFAMCLAQCDSYDSLVYWVSCCYDFNVNQKTNNIYIDKEYISSKVYEKVWRRSK